MTKTCLCLLLHIIWAVTTQAQHKSHSLQSAVDALHRREAQLALRDYESAHASPDESGYYNESKQFSFIFNSLRGINSAKQYVY